MSISIVRLGTDRSKDEGLRIGTVRRPPRGVPKSQYSRQNWYDIWLPDLAPSAELIRSTGVQKSHERWSTCERRFKAELKNPVASRLLDLLAALSHSSNFAVGCYCADERYCHRSILRRALIERGAAVQ